MQKTSTMIQDSSIGGEPGVDVRKPGMEAMYSHLRVDCNIEVGSLFWGLVFGLRNGVNVGYGLFDCQRFVPQDVESGVCRGDGTDGAY